MRGAGILAAGAALSGCASSSAPSAAQPQVAAPTTTLLVSIPFQGNGQYPGIMQQLMEDYVDRNWTAKHPGVAVKTMAGSGSNGPNQGAATVTTAAIAGQPPDTLCGCCSDLQTYLAGDMLAPLDAYIKKANIDTSDFSPGHLQGLQSGGQQVALPQYDGPMVLTANLSLLDQLGLPYPDPNWSYQDATSLWRQIAGVQQNKRVFGAGLDTGDANYLVHGWGGQIGNADGSQCLLDSPACVGAYTWLADLLQTKVAEDAGIGQLRSLGFAMTGGWDIQSTAINLTGLKWDYLPMPVFPVGKPSTFINNDFNAICSYSKNPQDLIWDIFQFITLDPGMQQFQFKTTFITPNRKSLWPTWIELVRSVAPPLQGKHLEYFQGAVDYGWPSYYFKYQPLQADGILSNWVGQIRSGKVSPQLGLQQAAQELNAVEAAAAAMRPHSALTKAFPTDGPEIAMVPAGI